MAHDPFRDRVSKLVFAAALALTLSPGAAFARFGKSGRGSGGYPPASPPPVRPAPAYRYGYGYGYSPHYRYGWSWGYRPYLWGEPYIVAPYFQQGYPPPSQPWNRWQPEEDPLRFSLAFSGTGFIRGGGGVSVQAALEKARLGFAAELNGLFVPADDGTRTTDSIKLLNLHVTYALLASDRGRLRLGFGLDSAFAPNAVMAGPGFSLSGVVGLAGPLGLDGTVHLTPLPFSQVDVSGGLTLALGPVGLRGGWRRIWLNDNGAVDGFAHTDLFSGPYVSLGFAL